MLRSQLVERPLAADRLQRYPPLNFGLYCFRVVVIALSLSRPPTPKLTYCVVQILGTIIVVTLSRDHIKGNHLEKRAVKNHRMIRVELHPDVPMALDVLPLEKAAPRERRLFFSGGNASVHSLVN